jgi:hypothetical protein
MGEREDILFNFLFKSVMTAIQITPVRNISVSGTSVTAISELSVSVIFAAPNWFLPNH